MVDLNGVSALESEVISKKVMDYIFNRISKDEWNNWLNTLNKRQERACNEFLDLVLIAQQNIKNH